MNSFKLARINDVIEGVNYFYLCSNRSTGICGRLTLSATVLSFECYSENNSVENKSKDDYLPSFLPFFSPESSSSSKSNIINSSKSVLQSNIDIYLLNIGDVNVSHDGNFIILSIYCSDFRCAEFQLKSGEFSTKIIEKLKYLSSKRGFNAKLSKLTQSLKDNYGYIFKADWDWYEGHWYQCYKLRVTQCNESFQLCDSLPSSFVVPNSINDATLLNVISTQTKGQRVPVVTFLNSKNGFMLIRSASFDYYDNLVELLQGSITVLREIKVDSLLPSLNSIDIAYEKLREACYQYNDSGSFYSKISKWISCLSSILKTVKNVSKILTHEASVGLIEDDDRHWNSVISALTQIMIDPKRRTFSGFESLISKEFIYFNGFAYRANNPRNPNHILFTLFLDCVFQLMNQNENIFEFTSFYLIWLFDCQFMQHATCQNDNKSNQSRSSFTSQTAPQITPQTTPSLTDELSLKQMMLFHNPFYKQTNESLKIDYYTFKMKFWSSLYLRWHTKNSYNCDLTNELIYLMELESRYS